MNSAFSLSLWPDVLRCHWKVRPARSRLEVYPAASNGTGPAVLVFPGGGYGTTSLDEGCRVARRLSNRGVTAGVCLYRVAPDRYPAPLVDGCRAVRLFRSLASELGFDAGDITLLGFSAGAHLAGLVATEPEPLEDPAGDAVADISHAPDQLALIYPLVSLLGRTHVPSIANLLGEQLDAGTRAALSIEHRVTQDLPPPFIVHAADDVVVPVAQSLALALRCIERGLYPTLHVTQHGGHGFATIEPPAGDFDWFEHFVHWLHSRKVKKEK